MTVIIITYDYMENADVFKVNNVEEGRVLLNDLYCDAIKYPHNKELSYINDDYAQVVNGINRTEFRLAKFEA